MKTKLLIAAIMAVSTSTSWGYNTDQFIGKNYTQQVDQIKQTLQGYNYTIKLDSHNNVDKILVTGLNGNGTDPNQLPITPDNQINMPVNYAGEDAIDFVGTTDFPKLAKSLGMSQDYLKQQFIEDPTMRVDENGQVFFVDEAPATEKGLSNPFTSKSLPIAQPNIPLTQAFNLSSKPNATKTIYLDFNGHIATGTNWSPTTPINAPAFSLDTDKVNFSDTEKQAIINIWSRVAEDYSPFDVNVTTIEPDPTKLVKSDIADGIYGTRVVITTTFNNCNCGGIAYVGIVNWIYNQAYQPAWVFQNMLSNNEKYIAEAVSHEAGHTLGLSHERTSTTSYYLGHGAGETSWAPIMGAGYYKNITQWSVGDFPDAQNKEDQISIILSKGINYSNDDYGNSMLNAGTLTNVGTANIIINTNGIIERSDDIDMFVFNANTGYVDFKVSPYTFSPNVDLKLTLMDSTGKVLLTDAPETSLSARVYTRVLAGTYYLQVSTTGKLKTATDPGYSNYGNIGSYNIVGTYNSQGPYSVVTPTAKIGIISATGVAPFTVPFSATNSLGGPFKTYYWDFGDGTPVGSKSIESHMYTKAGTYTAKLTVTNEYGLTSSATQVITVTTPVLSSTWVSNVNVVFTRGNPVSRIVATIKVVDDSGKGLPYADVYATFGGNAVCGSVVVKTDLNGNAIFNGATSVVHGNGTITVTNIYQPQRTYNPAKNNKTITTIVW